MSDYRVVLNEQTGLYRVERRRWWGWTFVMDPSGDEYLSFRRYRDAMCFVCRRRRQQQRRPYRRWKVVNFCERLCPSC